MKILKINKYFKAVFLVLITTLISCETTDLDLQTDPSNATPAEANPDLVLNAIQLRFVRALNFNEDNEDGTFIRAAEFVRMQHMFGNYTGPFSLTNSNINESWRNIYADVLQDVQTLIEISEPLNFQGHIGVSKILQAYLLVTLADTYGEAPFSEALKGNTNKNPKVDSGSELYAAALANLDEAIVALNLTKSDNSINMPDDLFYEGDEDLWIKCANSIKLKMLLQTRLVDADVSAKILTLLNEPLITDASDDFQFQYTGVAAPTDSRHPYYSLNYDASGADDYLNSYYVNLLLNDKAAPDPRLRYYFYRQTETEPTGDNLPCDGLTPQNFCYLGDLYWTRDHGADDGVPADGLLRSTYGIYPFGGAFDDDSFASVTNNLGAGGRGIFPILLNFYINFMLSEIELTINNDTSAARARLEMAINQSIEKVINFKPDGNTGVDATFRPMPLDITNYVTEVLTRFDAATTNEDRLDVIIKEYYISLWGNGMEAYNNYRRTSFPSDISDPVINAGQFPRSFLYPSDAVELNASISQKPVSDRVFWDTNPDELK